MAAFQQRRREQRPALAASIGSASDEFFAPSALAASDEPLLLFPPPAPLAQSADSSAGWAVVPPGRATRTVSYDSSAPSQSTTDSPASLREASLLPAHAGDGVFLESDAAASLVQSDALLPSVYADPHSLSEGDYDDDGALLSGPDSSIRSRRPILARRDSLASSSAASTFSSGLSSFDGESSWALTEAALSTLPTTSAATRFRAGQRSSSLARIRTLDEEAEDADAKSAGLTSGSEAENEPVATSNARSAQTVARHARQEDDDWALSPLALSAGILPPTRRRRQPPPPASSALGRSLAAAAALHHSPLSPAVGSTALRSLSPVSSTRSRASARSSGYKRRHRFAGAGRTGDDPAVAASQRRSSAGVQQHPHHFAGEYAQRIMRQEEERARRMREVLEQRREEDKLREAQDKVLFGSAVRAYMSIEPSTLALLASTPTPTASAYPTPTPSRSASPTRQHGASAFAVQASRELRLSSFGATNVDDNGDLSDAATETEAEHAPANWTQYSSAVPPAASLRPARRTARSRPTEPATVQPARSHSTSDLPSFFLKPLSASTASTGTASFAANGDAPSGGLGLVVPARRPGAASSALMRRNSSFDVRMHDATSFESSALSSPDLAREREHQQQQAKLDFARLSHEERILLGPPAAASSRAAGASGAAESAWGGELDSFELALSYWKRLLRRLKAGAGLIGGEGEDGAVQVVGVY
ncbi:hypothetical protein Rhopal_005831-T1 [Rhodotorula paludigena]|uniref:Proteophosphoglycan ppg4 n=1 Tax=Rhodotorula paludigena TaxID=86838 RepID=A0AAV5GRF8_9BASI|nr:hypothetical protein Rhopal_005831-T1 [Rhodotorula paludigena]